MSTGRQRISHPQFARAVIGKPLPAIGLYPQLFQRRNVKPTQKIASRAADRYKAEIVPLRQAKPPAKTLPPA
jgi:hypothetical protein